MMKRLCRVKKEPWYVLRETSQSRTIDRHLDPGKPYHHYRAIRKGYGPRQRSSCSVPFYAQLDDGRLTEALEGVDVVLLLRSDSVRHSLL